MRVMSFAATIPQMKARTKTVTRRLAVPWFFSLRPGDRILAVEKSRGVRLADRKELGIIEIVKVGYVWLHKIDKEERRREGFPSYSPTQFCEMFIKLNGWGAAYAEMNRSERRAFMRQRLVTRIEFKFVTPLPCKE